MTTYAIVGFGCAGYNALTAIRSADPHGLIDIYSEHGEAPYNPMLTTYYAADRLDEKGLFPFGSIEAIGKSFDAHIYTNTRVISLDAASRTLTLQNGRTKSYDKILLATGAAAFVPPIENEVPERTLVMRTLQDAHRFRDCLEKENIRKAVIIGASMVGIKPAEILLARGISTTVADMAPHIFPLAAYPDTAERIENYLKDKGLEMRFAAGLSAIRKGTDYAASVVLGDGSTLNADLVLLCIGTRASAGLARNAGIAVGRCITVNENMETSAKDIYAAGDCTEGCNLQSKLNMNIGLWANAAYQGRTAGANMAGAPVSFAGNILHNITHFCDLDFVGFGDNRIKGENICFENPQTGLFIHAVIAEGRLAGINILGNYRISGIIKNHFLSVLSESAHRIPELQRGILRKEGLSEELICLLEGGYDGN